MNEAEFPHNAPTTPEAPALSQWQRVSSIFLEPSKTFEQIRLGRTSWWLPFVLFIVVGSGLWATVTYKVGWEQVATNAIHVSPKQEARMEQQTPEQQATQKRIAGIVQSWIWGLAPVGVLLMNLIGSAIMLGTINFGFGGRATFGKVFAVSWYAGLPGLIKLLLGTVGLLAGVTPEGFLPQNPAGTNLGFYIAPPDVSMGVWSLLTSMDFIMIWTLVLFSIGLAKVAGTKRSTGFYAVFGWWVLSIVLGTAVAAITS
jgi:hypothetical protein